MSRSAAVVLGVVLMTGGGPADSLPTSQFALGTPGVLMGISVTPQPVSIGEPAMITLSGFGDCGTVIVDFGDRSTTTLTNVKFPRTVAHTYVQKRRVTASAKAGMNCNMTSRVQATFAVEGSLDLLCALTGCDDIGRPAPCPTPVIKSVFYMSPLEPTENVALLGCGFGDKPQTVNLKGTIHKPGEYGAAPNTLLPMTIVSWSPTHVIAKVPAITGTQDQTAAVQIVLGEAPKARNSNSMPVAFQATREIRGLSEADGREVIHTVCQQSAPLVASICEVYFGVAGVHRLLYPDWPKAEDMLRPESEWGPARSGIDYIVVSLANGWAIETYDTEIGDFLHSPSWQGEPVGLWWFWSSNEWPFKTIPVDASAFIPGASSGALKFAWTLNPGEKTHFRARVMVRGPIGVPLK